MSYRRTTLGEHIDLLTGYPFKSQGFSEDSKDIRLLRGDNVAPGYLRWDGAKYWASAEGIEDYLLCEGDVILAMDRPWIEAGLKFAAVRRSDLPALLVQRVARLRGRSTLDTKFLKYVVAEARFTQYILSVQTGTTVPHISPTQIKNYEFDLPPLPVQQAIANILGTLDDKIELNRKMNETLEAMARLIYKSWFIDFYPVSAKADGRQPNGVEPETAALFPDRFQDTEFGEIPIGWQYARVGDLIELDKGLSYKGEGLGVGLPMINLGCFLGNGRFDTEKIKLYGGQYKDRHLVRAGDLLLANTDMTQNRITLGSPGIAQEWRGHTEFLFSHHTYAARRRQGVDSYWVRYLYYLLLQDGFRERAAGFATGTTVLALPKEAVLDLTFPRPPEQLVRHFDEFVSPLQELRASNDRESENLARIRDALLPKLLSGEIRVRDAEHQLEAAL